MAGRGGGGGNIVFTILWLIILIFIGFWIAGFCAGFHILFQPFAVFIEGCAPIQEILMKGMLFPKLCAENMRGGKGFS